MTEILHHPAIGPLLFCLLSLLPLAIVFRRVGLSPLWTMLIFANFLLPFLGIALIAAALGHRHWSKIPKLAPAPKPIKKDWGATS
jgi:hypothetical protein